MRRYWVSIKPIWSHGGAVFSIPNETLYFQLSMQRFYKA